MFTFGCSIMPRAPVTPSQPAPEPGIPSQQAPPEPKPGFPQEQADIIKPEEPVTPSKEMEGPRSTVPDTGQADSSAPRAVASLRLTEQARLLIDSGKPDDAISTLEKAININPGNGQNYFYLAEAWIMKGNKAQALEFNRIAENYLNNDRSWAIKVRRQKEGIEKMKDAR